MQETEGRMVVVDMDGWTMLILRCSRMAASERDIVMLTFVTGNDRLPWPESEALQAQPTPALMCKCGHGMGSCDLCSGSPTREIGAFSPCKTGWSHVWLGVLGKQML